MRRRPSHPTLALAVVALVLVAIAGYAWLSPTRGADPTATGLHPAGVDTAGLPTLVELGMDSCAACKAMHGVLDELRAAHPGALQIVEINISAQPESVRDWRILAIPTQVLLDARGRELDRHIGFLSADAIRTRFAAQGIELTVIGAER
jgi:thioredoxin 1